MIFLAQLLFLLLCALPMEGAAQPPLPPVVMQASPTAFAAVGSGRYTKFGFLIYHVTLWAPAGQYHPESPYALQLHYATSLSKSTVADTVMGNIREQQTADAPSLARWASLLKETLPAVKSGDTLIGLALPGKASVLYLNGAEIGRITEKALSTAFFGIWLGDTADKELRQKLLGK